MDRNAPIGKLHQACLEIAVAGVETSPFLGRPHKPPSHILAELAGIASTVVSIGHHLHDLVKKLQ